MYRTLRNNLWFGVFAAIAIVGYSQRATAALIVNAAAPITHTVTVQPIIVSNDDGMNTAEFFGDAIQQANIESLIDSIWAQAGIDVEWLTANTWDDSFANIGTSEPAARPTSDLSAIVNAGDAAIHGGTVGNTDPSVIDMYFVEIAAGFSQLSDNTANGLAFVCGNGITMHVGDNLVGFLGGREVVASVAAHEIGHNLGLFHIVEAENLMQAGGSPNQGERLNATQIATALASSLSQLNVVANSDPTIDEIKLNATTAFTAPGTKTTIFVNEGTALLPIDVTVSDADEDTITVSFNVDNGSTQQLTSTLMTTGGTGTSMHNRISPGSIDLTNDATYLLDFQVDDGNGGMANIDDLQLIVQNVAASLTTLTASVNPIFDVFTETIIADTNDLVTFTFTFAEPGADDLTLEVDFDGDSVFDFTQTLSGPGPVVFMPTYTFTTAGMFDISFQLTESGVGTPQSFGGGGQFQADISQANAAAVPEPTAILLSLIGLAVISLRRRRHDNR